ncbi:ribonuclease H-like [Mauremys mutica]|uniref:ribonuclease H-like n=1 Tax=Mauremys mutica TaxID=74926 RepID=UPI001D1378BF|nr:ribonuclease H-like [Mauremys mutica]
MLPYALLSEGEEHECPLPETELKLVEEAPPVDEVLNLQLKEVWFTVGSSYHERGKQNMGYAAVQIDVKTISGSMNMTSAQGAEVRALSDLLKLKNNVADCLYVYMDSDFVVQGLLYWIGIWKKNHWETAEVKKLVQKENWKSIYDWLKKPSGKLRIRHIKGHQK